MTATEKLLRFTANGANGLSNKAFALRGLKGVAIASKGIGALGAVATLAESLSDGKFTTGDGAKVLIGAVTAFTPWGWVYGAIDV